MIRKSTLALLILLLPAFTVKAGSGTDLDPDPDKTPVVFSCSEPGSEYYTIDLVTTKNIPGTGQASGKAVMKFNPNPFGISIAKDGSYRHLLDIQLKKAKVPATGNFVAWVTTPSLDQVKSLGTLNADMKVSGIVEWNKYIVVITMEKEEPAQDAAMWNGPIAFRGLSKSGLMHTMAGHGPFAQEPCAKYGYY